MNLPFRRQFQKTLMPAARVAGAVRLTKISVPAILMAMTLLALTVATGHADVGDNTRISRGLSGTQPNADSYEGAVSDSGRYVAFVSRASNLVSGDTKQCYTADGWQSCADVFLRDRVAGTTTRISVGPAGVEADGESGDVSISRDGQYIAFTSWATNLVAGDTNENADVFVYDRVAKTTQRVSVGTAGEEGSSGASVPSMSKDGRFVAFQSQSAFAPDDENGDLDIYVRDRDTDKNGIYDEPNAVATILVSRGSADSPALGGYSTMADISENGRFVAFLSRDDTLVTGDTPDSLDVFVRDRDTDGNGIYDESGAASTSRVSAAPGGAQPNGEAQYHVRPAISDDGRFVAFISQASNLVANDTNECGTPEEPYNCPDAFVHGRNTGTTARVSIGAGGVQANWSTYNVDLSADGRYVAFGSAASNLVSGDTLHNQEVFIRDRSASRTYWVNTLAARGGDIHLGSISSDARFVPVTAGAAEFILGDNNDAMDVYLSEFQETASATLAAGGTVTTDTENNGAVASDKVETSITAAKAGYVAIVERVISRPQPAGAIFFGQEVSAIGLASTATSPYRLAFRLDPAVVPDSIDHTGLEIFRNGVRIGNCTDTSGTANPDPCVSSRVALADGDSQITVLASQLGWGVAWNTGMVDAPPTISITSPAANAWIKGTVTLSATASDDRGVSYVEFYVTTPNNPDEWTFRDTTAPYSVSWNTVTDPNANASVNFKVSARAVDSSGRATTATRTFNLDNAPPSINVYPSPWRPLATPVLNSAVNLSTSPERVSFRAQSYGATDYGSGIASYKLEWAKITNGVLGPWTLVGQGTTPPVGSLSLQRDGRYQLRMTVTDKIGNVRRYVDNAFTVGAVQESSSSVVYGGTWTTSPKNSVNYGGYTKYASASGRTATFTFTGKGFSWVAPKGTNRGKADIYNVLSDGSKYKLGTVDLYAGSTLPRRLVYSYMFGKSNGTYKIQVRVLGAKNASATGTRVDVDGFIVLR